MSSRTDILENLRKSKRPQIDDQLPDLKDRDLFQDYPESKDDLLDNFNKQLKKLSGSMHMVSGLDEAATVLKDILKDIDPKACRAHQSPLLSQLKNHDKDFNSYLTYIDGETINSEDFAQFEVGITEADCLIARTGSILIHTTSSGGRRLSVLPPTHIVIAKEDQLVPSIEDALQKLDQAKDDWSYATIITGPSRTSDIEKQLVLGAHGPKRLIVILIKG
jgi:L-lactate dehydrogenase complex protein LldG